MNAVSVSVEAANVIANLSALLAKSPTGVSFVSIKGYTNSYGEVANNLVNVGASYENAKAKDVATLQAMDVTSMGGDTILLEKARVELINSFLNPNENRSNGQKDAYTHICKGIKVHNETGAVYIFGLREQKKVIIEGTYPVVNSRPLTLAKNQLKKGLVTNKFTQYNLSKADFTMDKGTLYIEF